VDKREFKDQVYTLLSKLVKAMANPHRLEIIDLLGQGERSVEDISIETGLSVANASQHLQQLKQANLVKVRRDGNYIYYRLAHDDVYKSWNSLRAIGIQSFAEIDRLIKDFRTQKNSLEPVSLNDLVNRMQSNDVILLDVRQEGEFKAGHIPKAVNIPIDQLIQRLDDLDKSKQYIAYCRGPFCVFADEAVELLRKHRFNACRMEEGFPDWKIKGLPVEIAA
jgi:rhodanese-related sulfurtransferase/predicted transcriptional regulator